LLKDNTVPTIFTQNQLVGRTAVKEELFLAPASSHNLLSSPACVKTAAKLGAMPSKTPISMFPQYPSSQDNKS
jgi:hypothetical protein